LCHCESAFCPKRSLIWLRGDCFATYGGPFEPIGNGLFTTNLDFGSDAFHGDARWLDIAVRCPPGSGSYTPLGRQALTAVPYALYAQKAGGYEKVIVVAKSGGDYASIQAAIDSIGDAGASSPYLVWVAPGVYSETVTMKPYVHLQGAGQEATVITSTASSASFPPAQATLVLTSETSLRDLTVGNSGAGGYHAALMATAGTTRTLVSGVTARAQGGGTINAAIVLTGTGVTLRDGFFTGRGGDNAIGIYNNASVLEAWSVTALAEGATQNRGLYNIGGALATLRGGSCTARGGSDARGIYNTAATLEATGVTVLGEGGTDNYGLYNNNGASATLNGGSFAGRGGTHTRGIFTYGSGTTLEAISITTLAEGAEGSGADNYGLYHAHGLTYVTASVLEGGTYSVCSGAAAILVSNSRVVGGTSGPVNCVGVSHGLVFNTTGCP
jgi:hypothetical protein